MSASARRAIVAVAAALTLLLPATGTAATPSAGHLRSAIASNADFSRPGLAKDARRNQFVILQAWETDKLAALKAANPDVRVLMYENLSAARWRSNDGIYSTGISYQAANAHHPGWFLRNTSGSRFTFDDDPALWAMDVGSRSYQRRWAKNVIGELRAHHWDGVFVDDTDTTMRFHYDPSMIAEYPTDRAWQAATRSALATIGPRIRRAGYLAIPNIGSWSGYPSVGDSWLRYVSGAMDEMFIKWGDYAGSGYADHRTWRTQLASLKYAQRHGKEFLAVTHSANGDERAALYGWATVLLGANGDACYALHGDYTHENWFPEYNYDIGRSTGAESTDSNGVHRRLFSNGIVLVNPTSGQHSAHLRGIYSGSGVANVSRVALPAHSGYVLVRTGR